MIFRENIADRIGEQLIKIKQNMPELRREYPDKIVVFYDRVIGFGNTMDEAVASIREEDKRKPYLLRFIKNDGE